MILLLSTNIGYAILRAEGDAKRAMYVMGASSILNMVLDPLLIYTIWASTLRIRWYVQPVVWLCRSSLQAFACRVVASRQSPV